MENKIYTQKTNKKKNAQTKQSETVSKNTTEFTVLAI